MLSWRPMRKPGSRKRETQKIERSMAAVAAARQEEQFAAARNAEIEISLSAVNARQHPIETGSIAQ